jgi:CheY-like chemotaxis protein
LTRSAMSEPLPPENGVQPLPPLRLVPEPGVNAGPFRTILVVEDDPESRDALRLALKLAGHTVHTAAHGQEALDLLRAGSPPDLILLDLMMPVLSGWQFREVQRQNPALAGIPVVILSAVGERESQADSLGDVA